MTLNIASAIRTLIDQALAGKQAEIDALAGRVASLETALASLADLGTGDQTELPGLAKATTSAPAQTRAPRARTTPVLSDEEKKASRAAYQREYRAKQAAQRAAEKDGQSAPASSAAPSTTPSPTTVSPPNQADARSLAAEVGPIPTLAPASSTNRKDNGAAPLHMVEAVSLDV